MPPRLEKDVKFRKIRNEKHEQQGDDKACKNASMSIQQKKPIILPQYTGPNFVVRSIPLSSSKADMLVAVGREEWGISERRIPTGKGL
jgi:hypothetical protein